MGCRILHGLGALLCLGPSDHLGSSWGWGSWWALVSFQLRCWGVVNSISNLLFSAPPANGVGLALGFVGSFGVWVVFLVVGDFLDRVVVLQSCEVWCFMSPSEPPTFA